MIRDINTKKVMKNAFRITKNKYQTSPRVRIPGGCADSRKFDDSFKDCQ